MSIAQLSPKSIASDPAYVNPQVKIDQKAAVAQNSQLVQKTDNIQKSDTVTLSRVALQKAGNEDASAKPSREKEVLNTPAEEKKERFSAMA
jgi:hypothetical protein